MNESFGSQAQEAGAGIGLIDAFSVETAVVVGGAIVALVAAHLVLLWINRRRRVPAFFRQSILIGLTVVALVTAALTLRDPVRDQVLKFLGVLFSAALAFSSTTIIGNALAGLMLRAQRHFRGGDWVEIGDHFGQAVHRGLLFTTIQDEFKDLVTLPNSLLASQPVTVIEEPTYISTQVSLGYDVPRGRVEHLLLEAAEATGLEKPYVYVLELGDFSVVYRVSGKLMKTDELLTMRSNLRCRVLDALHEGGVEVVSPAFMNQRVLADGQRFIPRRGATGPEPPGGPAPEAETFDKGRQAKTVEELEDTSRSVEEKLLALRGRLQESDSEEGRQQIRAQLERLEQGKQRLLEEIEALQEQAGQEE